MAAGFEVRNNTPDMGVMLTIQVLVQSTWADVADLDAAQTALSTAYASAFAELSQRVEAAQRHRGGVDR